MTLRNKHALPHYLTGLGEGVGAGRQSREEDDDAYISYLRRSARDRNAQRLDHSAAAAYVARPQADSNKAWGNYYYPTGGASLQHDPTGPTSIGPWQIAAFALLGAVILLSALFLHILADGTTGSGQQQQQQQHQHASDASFHASAHHKSSKHHHHRRSKRRSLYKKKTDEWSDDESDLEADLLSESVREGVYRRTESQEIQEPLVYDLTTTTATTPNYPYHPQQQSRQRKNSSTQQHQHQQQPFHHSRNIYQAPAYRYPTPSNRAASFSPSFSPSIAHRATVTPAMAGPLMPTRGSLAESSSESAEGIRVISEGISSMESFTTPDSLSNHGGNSNSSSSNNNGQPQLQPRPSMRSSGRKASPTVTIQEPIREENSTPDPGPRELLLPPPINSLVEKTPRVRNGKVITTADDGMPFTTPSPDRRDSHIEVDSGTEDAVVMPFLPNLNSSLGAGSSGSNMMSQQHPEPVNMNDLQIYTRMESGMESGTVFWQRASPHASPVPPGTPLVAAPDRLPPPPPMAQDQQALLCGDISEHFLEMQDSIDESGSLDSNDPRKNIQHKRDFLLEGTNAAASLQGAVNFSDLELKEVIGGGGFGQVWKAMWNGTPVAVKVLTGSAQAHHVPRAILEEFAAEINLLKGMRHPNICLYMGACLAPPNRAIITELAANGSLWDALRLPLSPPYTPSDGVSRHAWPMCLYQPDPRHGVPPSSNMRTVPHVAPKGTWPWVLVKKVACGSARGMNYLHNGKPPVLHRDLKSANILLDESYTPKVCDFGLSRLKAQDRSMTGNCGTVQWMAPEVLANQAYNEKADVYSYGIILWELLTRQCPYDDMSAIQCALAVLNRNHRPEIPRWCPPAMQVLIRSCVKKNPDERPSFTDILQALDEMP